MCSLHLVCSKTRLVRFVWCCVKIHVFCAMPCLLRYADGTFFPTDTTTMFVLLDQLLLLLRCRHFVPFIFLASFAIVLCQTTARVVAKLANSTPWPPSWKGLGHWDLLITFHTNDLIPMIGIILLWRHIGGLKFHRTSLLWCSRCTHAGHTE